MSVTKLLILIIVSVTMIVMTGLYRGYSVEVRVSGLEQKLHLSNLPFSYPDDGRTRQVTVTGINYSYASRSSSLMLIEEKAFLLLT
jgi:hypothetical protein